ncbi:MAG: MFS transporter [Bacteroides xylanisolvens]
MMKTKNKVIFPLISVMLAFFAMGFVDLVGIATNYIKADFNLSDTMANLLPSMVFLWFLIFSIPTSVLMSKIGKRKTVMISIAVTAVSLIIPYIEYSFTSMLISFSLLGIGNALMQVSLNPLLTSIVSGDRLASSLTFGQFIKAIASFIAPLIAAWGVSQFDSWMLLFPIFFSISVVAVLLLGTTKIEETKDEGNNTTFGECFSLMGDKVMLFFFIGIMCHVGIDVGTNVTAPKLLMEHLEMPISEAGYATSIYFMFRTIGCFLGAFILAFIPSKRIFAISILMMVAAAAGLFFSHDKIIMYTCIALIGLGNSNVFPIIMSQALLRNQDKQNEVSGLLIMGLCGGALFPLLMGLATDMVGSQSGALIIISTCVAYLLFVITQLKTIKTK